MARRRSCGCPATKAARIARTRRAMEKHPDSDRLAQALGRCERLLRPWAGVVYRSASVGYANRDDLLTGTGARQAGARWNPPSSMATVYTSLELETAVEEAFTHHRYYQIAIETALPRVLVSVRAVLQRVLNLVDQDGRRRLGVRRG